VADRNGIEAEYQSGIQGRVAKSTGGDVHREDERARCIGVAALIEINRLACAGKAYARGGKFRMGQSDNGAGGQVTRRAVGEGAVTGGASEGAAVPSPVGDIQRGAGQDVRQQHEPQRIGAAAAGERQIRLVGNECGLTRIEHVHRHCNTPQKTSRVLPAPCRAKKQSSRLLKD